MNFLPQGNEPGPNAKCESPRNMSFPIGSMYGIFPHIWLIFMVNVGKYTIHGSYGFGNLNKFIFFSTQKCTKTGEKLVTL